MSENCCGFYDGILLHHFNFMPRKVLVVTSSFLSRMAKVESRLQHRIEFLIRYTNNKMNNSHSTIFLFFHVFLRLFVDSPRNGTTRLENARIMKIFSTQWNVFVCVCPYCTCGHRTLIAPKRRAGNGEKVCKQKRILINNTRMDNKALVLI